MRTLLYTIFVAAATITVYKFVVIPDWSWTDYYIGFGRITESNGSLEYRTDDIPGWAQPLINIDRHHSVYSRIIGNCAFFGLLVIRLGAFLVPLILYKIYFKYFK